MQCPVCETALREETRHEVAMASCPQGHGVWLSNEAVSTIVRRTEQDYRTAGQLRQPGSGSMKHARREEDWIDYFPDQASKLPKPFIVEIFEK